MSPIKEPYFFIAEYMRRQQALGEVSAEDVRAYEHQGRYRTIDAYTGLFEGATDEVWIGESSHYLYAPDVCSVIQSMSRDAKIIVSFRDPTQRLVSEYGRLVRNGTLHGELADFAFQGADVKNGKIVSIGKTSKLVRGLQAARIDPWLQAFGSDRVKCIFFEDLSDRPLELARELYAWLDIDQSFVPELVHTQKGGHARRPGLLTLMNKTGKWSQPMKRMVPRMLKEKIRASIYDRAVVSPVLTSEVEAALRTFYADDIVRLQELTGKDLSHWLGDC